MNHVTRIAAPAIASALACAASATDLAGGLPQAATALLAATNKPSVQAPPQKAWHDSLKGIPLGPGALDVGVNIRTRYEYADNWDARRFGTAKEDNLLLLRSRLSLDYHFGKPAHAYAEFQDARYWLSDLRRPVFPGSNPFYDEYELRQAYLEWEHIGNSPAGFKVGRQSISYADRRVFGPGEWGNVGRYWWDAAKAYWHTDLVKADLLYGRRIVSEPSHFNDEHYPFHMAALYAQFRQFTNGAFTVKPDAFYVGRYDTHGNLAGESGAGDELRHTVGLRAEGKLGRAWDYYGTAAGQFGAYGQDDIAAFGVVGGLGCTFKAAWSPRLGVEFCYASGDNNPSDGKRGTFDNVYGAMDAYLYGWMNMVCWMNLEDYQMSFAVRPTKNLKAWAEYHYFRLASAKDAWYYGTGNALRRDATGNSGQDLGHEINLLGQWKLTKSLDLLGGYGCFLPGGFARRTVGNSHPAHWFFTQLTFNF